LGSSLSPSSVLIWSETFPYPGGPLDGNNGWTNAFSPTSDWIVAANHITTGVGVTTDTNTLKDLTATGYDVPGSPWSLTFTARTVNAGGGDTAVFDINIGDTSGSTFLTLQVNTTNGVPTTSILGLADAVGTTFTNPICPWAENVDHAVELRWNGTNLDCIVDGFAAATVASAVLTGVIPTIELTGIVGSGGRVILSNFELRQ
jgi:hypothetical protein